MTDRQPHCGHPVECIVSSDEGTNYCGWCNETAALLAEIKILHARLEAYGAFRDFCVSEIAEADPGLKTHTRVIIAGGRDFDDYDLMAAKMDQVLEKFPDMIVISGGAVGADTLGEVWAGTRAVALMRFLPDWERYGKSAGYKRNEQMAREADLLVAFWDGESRGTKHMIEIARRRGLKVWVIDTASSNGK